MPVSVPKALLWRVLRAKCYDCRAGYRGHDCEITSCPLYAFLPQGNLDPCLWWMESAHKWRELLDVIGSKKMIAAREARDRELQAMFALRSSKAKSRRSASDHSSVHQRLYTEVAKGLYSMKVVEVCEHPGRGFHWRISAM